MASISADLVPKADETVIIDDSDPVLAFLGSWQATWGSNETEQQPAGTFAPYRNTTHQTSNLGDSLQIAFNAGGQSGLTIYGIVDTTQIGNMQMLFTIDDGVPKQVEMSISAEDLAGAQGRVTKPNVALFTTPPNLSPGMHNLTAKLTQCVNQQLIIDYITATPGTDVVVAINGSATASPYSTSYDPPSGTRHVGAIAGGVVGGVAMLVLLGGLLSLCFRRRQRQTTPGRIVYPFRYGAFWATNVNTTLPVAVVAHPVEGVSEKKEKY